MRLGVCIGEFHNKLMDRMLEDARVSAEAMGSTIDKVVWVPGTYEAPLVVENMLQDPTLDAASSSDTSKRARPFTVKRWARRFPSSASS